MKSTFLLALLTIVLCSSCNIDRRVYRRGYMIAESEKAEISQENKGVGMPVNVENSCEKEESKRLTPNVSATFNYIVTGAVDANDTTPESVSVLESVSESIDNIRSRSVDQKLNRALFRFPVKAEMSEPDRIRTHPLLLAASVMSMGLAGLFAGTLIYKISKGFVFPYFFPAANLLVVIIAVLSFLSFFIGKKMVKKKPEKWTESIFCKISLALMLFLGILYILYFFTLLFVVIFSVL